MGVPEGWDQTQLSAICVPKGLQTGPFGGQLHKADYVDSGVPVVMPKDMKTGRVSDATIARIPKAKADALTKHRCQPGDILFGRRGEMGRAALITSPEVGWLCGTGSLRARPSPTVSPDFLIYAVTAARSVAWLTEHAVGQTMLNLNTTILGSLPVQLPPLPEQRKIAAILSSVDEAIEKTQAVIDQVQVVKKGLMHELLTKGLPGRHKKFKQTEIGEIPEDWEVVALNEIVDQERPICYGILKPGRGHPGGVPVVKVKNIKGGVIEEHDLLLTTPELDHEYRRSRLKPGDVLLTIRGTTGRLAVVPASLDGANITQDTARVALLDRASRDFVRYAMESPVLQEQIKRNTMGQAVKGINIGAVRKLNVPLPPLPEQKKLAAIFSALDRRLVAASRDVEARRTVKQALMSVLLSGEIRVCEVRTDG